VVGSITFPPIPRAGNAAVNTVQTMAMGVSGLEFVMLNPANNTGTLWKVVGNSALPRTGTTVTGVSATGAQTALATAQRSRMIASTDGSTILLLGGTGTAYLYDALSDSYTASATLLTGTIIGYYGPVGAAPDGNYLLANGLVLNNSLAAIGGAASPGQVTITPPAGPGQPPSVGVSSTGLRNIAAVSAVDTQTFVRMSTPVRNNLTTATNDDIHTTLELVNTVSGGSTVAARMPENPILPEFGTALTAVPAHQIVVDSKGTAYALTVSGLSVVPTSATTAATAPTLSAQRPIVNAADGTTSFTPGSFVTITGTNLAAATTADALPPPRVLGGSCVLLNDVAIPLLKTGSGQMSGQIPADMRPGAAVMQVRSLANAQQSAPVVVTIQKP
jgi:hypothetical protein